MIGNSHLASFKLAVENGALDGTGADIVFFGAPGRRFRMIRLRDGVICGPRKLRDTLLQVSGGRYSEINPAKFDAVVICGASFLFDKLIGSIHLALKDQVHLTEECLATGIERWMTSRPVFELAAAIDKASSTTRTILVPRPIPAYAPAANSEVVDRNMDSPSEWDRLEPAFRRRIWDYCRQAAERRGVELFLQPESTIDANQHTKPEYTAHSPRLLNQGSAHKQDDVNHMNAKFGEVFLLSLLAHLAQATEHPQRLPDATTA